MLKDEIGERSRRKELPRGIRETSEFFFPGANIIKFNDL